MYISNLPNPNDTKCKMFTIKNSCIAKSKIFTVMAFKNWANHHWPLNNCAHFSSCNVDTPNRSIFINGEVLQNGEFLHQTKFHTHHCVGASSSAQRDNRPVRVFSQAALLRGPAGPRGKAQGVRVPHRWWDARLRSGEVGCGRPHDERSVVEREKMKREIVWMLVCVHQQR